jgi:hypothetical protein
MYMVLFFIALFNAGRKYFLLMPTRKKVLIMQTMLVESVEKSANIFKRS